MPVPRCSGWFVLSLAFEKVLICMTKKHRFVSVLLKMGVNGGINT